MNQRLPSRTAGSPNVRSLLLVAIVGSAACSLHLALNAADAADSPSAPGVGMRVRGETPRSATAGGTLWGVKTRAFETDEIYTIDPATGEATFVATIDERQSDRVGASFLADVLYVGNLAAEEMGVETASIDTLTGAPTTVSDQGGATGWFGMASDEVRGVLYAIDTLDGQNVLLSVDPDDGSVTPIGAGTGLAAVGLAYDEANEIVYALNDTDDSLYSVDVTSGTATLIGDTNQFVQASSGLAYDDKSGTLYMTRFERLYTLDLGTGEATLVGAHGVSGINGLAWQPAEVEPDPCLGCPCLADTDRNGDVGFAEILDILSQWGPCPAAARGPSRSRIIGLATGNPGKLYDVDAETGEATLLTELNGRPNLFTGLARLDEVVYGTNLLGYPGGSGAVDTGTIDEGDGTITFVSDQDYSVEWHGLAANENAGLLYTVDLDTDMLLTVAPDSTLTVVAPVSISARALAYDNARGILFATHTDNQLYTIDTATGAATAIGPLGVDQNFRPGLAYDAALGLLYLNISGGPDGDRLYSVNPSTGAATEIGPNGVSGIQGLATAPDLSACGSCPCPADVTRDGDVGFADVLAVLAAWGPCNEG